MRELPVLEFLNGLPIDKETLNDEEQQEQTGERFGTQKLEEVIPEDGEGEEMTFEDQVSQAIRQERSAADLSVNNFHSQNMSEIEQDGLGEHLDTAELEAIAICYDNIRHMRKRMPSNDDAKLGQMFDQSLRTMMDKVSSQLKTANNSEAKGRVAILAKRDLLGLLVKQFSGYLGYTDSQSESVFMDLIRQYSVMVD